MSPAFNISKTYRYAAILVTALFLLLQGASISHAASYGSDPHEHDGVECVLSLQNETQAIAPTPIAPAKLPALISSPVIVFETYFINAPTRLYRGREPPPRAPPSQQN